MEKKITLRLFKHLLLYLNWQKSGLFKPVLRDISIEKMELFPFFKVGDPPKTLDQNLLYENIKPIYTQGGILEKYQGNLKEEAHRGYLEMVIATLLKNLLKDYPVMGISVEFYSATIYFKTCDDLLRTANYLFEEVETNYMAMDVYEKSHRLVIHCGCKVEHRHVIRPMVYSEYDLNSKALHLPENKYRDINSITKKCVIYDNEDIKEPNNFDYYIDNFIRNAKDTYNAVLNYTKDKINYFETEGERLFWDILDKIIGN